jgi:hypothetical protein
VGSYGSKGYRITEVDGWGSVTTPFGTFDALRVVSYIYATDTINVAGTGFAVPNNRREYRWLSNDDRAPIVQVTGSEVFGSFVPTQTVYRDSWRRFAVGTSTTLNNELPFVVYNQADQFKATLPGIAGEVTLTDMLGRVMVSYTVQAGQKELSLPQPSVKGIYLVRFAGKDGAAQVRKVQNL